MGTPLLSICCITYNHKEYISQAIESFLMQETNFEYEILLYDDASNDGSQEIIAKFQEEYPKIIKPILQTENRYSKGERGMNFRYNYPRAKGKYIAICDGDDFWTDPQKLQIQVDFLESHSDYVLCFHDTDEIDEDDVVHHIPFLNQYKLDRSAIELKRGVYVFASTICYRNILEDVPEEVFKVVNEDTFTVSLLGNFGKAKYIDNIKAGFYRIQKNGVWSTLRNEQRAFHKITTYESLMSYYSRKNDSEMIGYYKFKLRNVYLGLYEFQLKNRNISSAKENMNMVYNLSSSSMDASWLVLKSTLKSLYNAK